MSWYEMVGTEEEALSLRNNLLKDGEYKCVVVDAIEGKSAAGNHVIKLTLQVVDKQSKLFTYLVGSKNMQWFVRHFCKSAGLMDKYMDGTFSHSMCTGRIVTAVVKTRPEQKNADGTVKYKESNFVEDFVEHSIEQPTAIIENFFNDVPAADDDIPWA